MTQNKLELGKFIHWDWGENYPFSACMMKIMECLGGDPTVYSYDFFAGISGDDFVMCYGNNDDFNDCVSVCTPAAPFLARVFGLIGLPYQHVKKEEWQADFDKYYAKIRDFIDRGIPVLTKGQGNDGNYDLLISYHDNGQGHLSCGDDENYGEDMPIISMDVDLIFIDHLPENTDMAAIYRAAVLQLPALMQAPATDTGTAFGAEAYRRWIMDIKEGRYNNYTKETFSEWHHWHIYICNLATNGGHGQNFLKTAYDYHPDMAYIPSLIALFHENDKIWADLEACGGGFNATLESLQKEETQKKIIDILQGAVILNQKITECIR